MSMDEIEIPEAATDPENTVSGGGMGWKSAEYGSWIA